MKMVCIKKGKWVGADNGRPFPYRAPNFGEIVEVVGSRDEGNGLAYFLAGYNILNSKGVRIGFISHHFRPLVKDGLDETTRESFDFRQQLKQDA